MVEQRLQSILASQISENLKHYVSVSAKPLRFLTSHKSNNEVAVAASSMRAKGFITHES